jgi:hypothetical protein
MTPRLPWPGLAAATAALTLQCLTPESGAAQAIAQRAIVVIGDLHMGAAGMKQDAGAASEDFRWAGEFSEVPARSMLSIAARLIVLNGDTFDLPRGGRVADQPGPRSGGAQRRNGGLAASATRHKPNRPARGRDSALRFGKVAERVVRALRSPIASPPPPQAAGC